MPRNGDFHSAHPTRWFLQDLRPRAERATWGTAAHGTGGLPQGSSYSLGQPWLRPRGPKAQTERRSSAGALLTQVPAVGAKASRSKATPYAGPSFGSTSTQQLCSITGHYSVRIQSSVQRKEWLLTSRLLHPLRRGAACVPANQKAAFTRVHTARVLANQNRHSLEYTQPVY
jgi:hypothetical protein